ncbi:hypothetical protein BGZ61DRAFT_561512 [Ilyonectria robusta]|uniref:uncharacterized protein n=1 Tax=Ilyonectria robusta TaxID=1079257 RepID=UPI001E8E3B86|nr:uncharacterized protein BGZ61DRAFT_561512 [Ilyonectria robusta]KAH8665424.1 hypothetical protein BGZ61DRAFT_561512 [Ilyonectria robusta]
MNSLASKCTEEANSTDCLLRTLLDFLEDARRKDDGKYEWDPITFGFTVAISLAAAGFALITIIQAVLAAGPARRKSNPEAIGKWAKMTEPQWKWRDFGYLYVAQTPILSVENIAAYLEIREARTSHRRTRPREYQRTTPREYQTPVAAENETENENDQRIQNHKGTGASWLTFLEMAGLADLDLGDKAIVTTVADYLPSDLVAVSAAVEVRLVFLLIALSQKPLWLLEPGSRCPSLTSPAFQFELRQHANMGLIGAFSSYKTMSFDLGKLSTDDLNLAAKHADGVLLISNRFTSGDSKTVFRFSGLSKKINITAPRTFTRWLALRSIPVRYEWWSLLPKFASLSKRPTYSTIFFGLVVAKAPRRCPPTFPWSTLPVGNLFTHLSISCNMTTEEQYDASSTTEQMPRQAHIFELILRSKYADCLFAEETSDQTGHCPCHNVVAACASIRLGFGDFTSWLALYPTEKLPQLRQDVLVLLTAIDFWLYKRSTSSHIVILSFRLLVNTLSLHQVLDILGETLPGNKETPTQLLTGFFQAYETPDSPHKYERNEKLKEPTGRFASQETFAEFEAVTQPMLENVKSLVDARNEAANQPMLIFGRGADVIIRGRRYAWEVEQEESPAVPFFIDTLNNRRGVASGADVTCPEYKTHKDTH